jgi:syntaxin 6
MLDEFGAEIEHADSRLDSTMKKMAKVLHLSNGNYQALAGRKELFSK